LQKFGSTAGGIMLWPILNFRSAWTGGAPIGSICRSELCREQSPLGALDLFDGLLVGIADRFELLREHRQGRIQVDWAPGVCAPAYGAVIRIAGSRSMLPDPLFLEGPYSYDARLLSPESPDATRPESRRPSV
jgi:hypothetical protein